MSFQLDNPIPANLTRMTAQLHGAIAATMEYFATQAEGYAKSNAPWTDQTGNARQGLSARAFSEPTKHVLVVFHTMPYGVWLEVRWSGRYAIILPTINHTGPQIMAAVRGILGRFG